ncbi:HNH endonuclease [Tolumonas lignilytica]|uniref:HNH endonuclease n=1 Tax=Tolumonas lignilytica TaxID=1283284 RepID=UPI000464A351|nr:HNH endonuclease [Tolumonas lignilytica]
MFSIITENDESQWSDDTGCLYHFPKRYLKYLEPGTKVIYYKGKLTNKIYSESRLTPEPHYFGIAEIGSIYPDKASDKNDYFATINKFIKFKSPVLNKKNETYYELIPESQKTNYWRNGVRPITESVYFSILEDSDLDNVFEPVAPYEVNKQTDQLEQFESYQEGSKTLKYVAIYERNPKLRRQAIAIHGTTCVACGFSFKEHYGEYAENFIHIHHEKPISDFDGKHDVNPETDLKPLCANCHAVVHLKKSSTLSIQELVTLLGQVSNK